MPILQGEKVSIGAHALQGELVAPRDASALVLFIHRHGVHGHSARKRFLADVLNAYHLATLSLELLTESESQDSAKASDLGLLCSRVQEAMAWVERRDDTAGLSVGLFGAGTGSAAALEAASQRPGRVSAVVSRGGRPELAPHLGRVVAPTLLIVGGRDPEVLALNLAALSRLKCSKRLEIVPGAGHGFEEPGALESVAHLAGTWFERHAPAARHT